MPRHPRQRLALDSPSLPVGGLGKRSSPATPALAMADGWQRLRVTLAGRNGRHRLLATRMGEETCTCVSSRRLNQEPVPDKMCTRKPSRAVERFSAMTPQQPTVWHGATAEIDGGNVKVLAYTRCSTEEQAVEGVSLSTQLGRIEAWCEATGAELAGVIEDAGVSGTRPLADRPGGARVASLLEARNPDVDAVIVVRLDRLARNAADALHYLHKFARGSVGLVSIDDRLDLASPQGKAMAQMSAVFAELERNLGAQRTSDALCGLRSLAARLTDQRPSVSSVTATACSPTSPSRRRSPR